MDFIGMLFDSNKRDLARLRKLVKGINDLEPSVQQLSDEQMQARIGEIRTEIQAVVAEHGNPHKRVDEALMQHLPEVFALCREAGCAPSACAPSTCS